MSDTETDEYTPTTEEIIEHWSATRGSAIDPEAAKRKAERERMFRRWLAAHDAEVRAGVVAEEPEWESDTIQYGHLLEGGIFVVEHKGRNYSTHQRRVKLGRPESSWAPIAQKGAGHEGDS